MSLISPHSSVWGIEVRWTISPATDISLNGYYQKYYDMITLQRDSTTGAIRATNVQEADVWGSELQAKHRWNTKWKSGFNYNYLSAVNPITHLQIATRPEHQGTLGNEIHVFSPLTWRMELNVHDGFWFDAKNSLRANIAPGINAWLKYDLTPKTQLYLRSENITNNQSTEINDFSFYGAVIYAGFKSNF